MRNQFSNDPNVEPLTESFSRVLLGERIPLDIVNSITGEIIVMANRKITKPMLRKLAIVEVEAHKMDEGGFEIDPSPIRNKLREIIASHKWLY